MKARITDIKPDPLGGSDFDVAFIEIGLTTGKLIGIKKNTFRVGDEIDVPTNFLGPNSDSLLMNMAYELQRRGCWEVEVVTDEELGERHSPISYHINEDVPEHIAGYFVRLEALMREIGQFHAPKTHVFYELKFPKEEWDLEKILELGYLWSECVWKEKHEAAALQEYKSRQNRLIGVSAAAREKRRKTKETKNIILNYASASLNRDPSLANNISELARCVLLDDEWCSGQNGMDPELKIGEQRVRKLIAELFRDQAL